MYDIFNSANADNNKNLASLILFLLYLKVWGPRWIIIFVEQTRKCLTSEPGTVIIKLIYR